MKKKEFLLLYMLYKSAQNHAHQHTPKMIEGEKKKQIENCYCFLLWYFIHEIETFNVLEKYLTRFIVTVQISI